MVRDPASGSDYTHPAYREGDPSTVRVPLQLDPMGFLKVTTTGAGAQSTVDVVDRAGRLVGVVSLDAASLAALEVVDVSDRSGRLLGVVTLDAASLAALETIQVGNFPATQPVSGTVALDATSLAALELTTVDVTDRPARELGLVRQGAEWDVHVQRPSARAGRTNVKSVRTLTTAALSTLYTVSAGKTLYVLSISLSAYNSAAVAGDVRIQDGAVEVELPLVVPPASVTGQTFAASPLSTVHMTFDEPKQFTNDFRVVVVTGTLTYACSFSGYEE